MIKPLEIQDQRHLEAAEGWIELGNHLEANEELQSITPENRAHPAVLEVRWQIYAKAKKWEAALDIASALIQLLQNFHWVGYTIILPARTKANHWHPTGDKTKA